MKKSIYPTLKTGFIFLLLCLAAACRSDDSNSNPEPQPTEMLRLKTYTGNGIEYLFTYNSDQMLSSYGSVTDVRNILYDSKGRVTRTGHITYTYDDEGRITKMNEDPSSTFSKVEAIFGYKAGSELVTSADITFTFRSSGKSTNFTRTFQYNDDEQLTQIIEQEHGTSLLNRFSLSYDAHGNITEIKEAHNPDGYGNNWIDGTVQTYTYDNKKNPRYAALQSMGIDTRLSLVYMFSMISIQSYQGLGNYVFHRINYYNPNNILNQVYSSSGTRLTSICVYEYNEYDYPISAQVTRTYDGGTDIFNYSWEYETYIEE